jgi:hypothetical protein
MSHYPGSGVFIARNNVKTNNPARRHGTYTNTGVKFPVIKQVGK